MWKYKFTNCAKVKCPQCGQLRFSRLMRIDTGELTDYGKCDRKYSCGYAHYPPKFSGAYLSQTANKITQKHETYTPALSQVQRKSIGYNIKAENCQYLPSAKPEFTIIAPPYKEAKALKQVSLTELIKLANALPPNLQKSEQLNVLKGIYPIGESTNGEKCVTPAGYLFFDVDYKPEINMNAWLATDKRKEIKEYLQSVALLVWDSWSGVGLAGLLYCPQLANIDNSKRDLHKAIAEQVYALIQDWVLMFYGVEIVFDTEQGKFRQVRFFGKQKEPVTLNLAPQAFRFYKSDTLDTSFNVDELTEPIIPPKLADCETKEKGFVWVRESEKFEPNEPIAQSQLTEPRNGSFFPKDAYYIVENEYSAFLSSCYLPQFEFVGITELNATADLEIFRNKKVTVIKPIIPPAHWAQLVAAIGEVAASVTVNNILENALTAQQKKEKWTFGQLVAYLDTQSAAQPQEPKELKLA